MLSKTILAAATVLLSAMTTSAAPTMLKSRDYECIEGVRVIVARGSDTPQDLFGAPNQMGQYVREQIKGSQNHNLIYPATLDNYEYSESTGVTNMTERITNHVDACPTQRFALIGYSQGAQVIADTLIGPTGTQGQGLAEKYRPNVVAVIQIGDPSFVAGYSFDAGSATTNGVIPRDNADQYISYGYAPRIKSYCDADDMYCASGNSLAIHEGYFTPDFMSEAQDWMVSIIPGSISS